MKALMYLPNVITAVSIAIFFQKIFGYNENPIAYPPANRIVTLFREEPFNFLRGVWSTRLIVCFINFWMWYGNTMIVLIAGITSISESLYESAQIDGAGYFKIFVSIISPLCKPVYATITLFVAVYHWNAWFDAMIYNKMHDELTVLQYELMKQLQTAMKSAGSVEGLKNSGTTITPTSIRAAATIVTMVPILFVYPFLQRYFVTGLTIGGVKE
jgi:putative aldouronate transport system permease protein